MNSINSPAPRRRTVLVAAAAGTATMLVGPGIAAAAASKVVPAKASVYPAKAFAQTSEASALKLLYGKTAKTSSSVKLGAPDIAENGAVVPITVSSSLPNVKSITILAVDNPFTIAASYKIPAGTNASIASRIKLAKTTKVVAVVESGGALDSASKPVKVTLGGCG